MAEVVSIMRPSLVIRLSTSDQTDHYRYVPIAAATPTALTPEQAAIWVYPQPEFGTEELWLSIVNGLLARPQLSGGIWKLSETQLDVLAKGVEVYKQYRHIIPTSTPVWPLGLPGWSDDWTAQGLRNDDDLYLAVWRRGGDDSIDLPLPGYGRGAIIETLFPTDAPGRANWSADGVLNITLPESGRPVFCAFDPAQPDNQNRRDNRGTKSPRHRSRKRTRRGVRRTAGG